MLKERAFRKALALCLFALFLFLPGCSDDKNAFPEALNGTWYVDVEKSIADKPFLLPSEQKIIWLLDGTSLRIDSEKKRMIGEKPGSEPREYMLRKVSDHVFASNLDEYGEVSLLFLPEGGLKLDGILPADLILSREKPEEFPLAHLDGAWKSNPAQTRSTHPEAQEAVEAFSIVINTKIPTIRFLAQGEEQTIPFRFSPEKGKAFRAAADGYAGEVLLIPGGTDTLKILSDTLVIAFERENPSGD